MNSSKYMDKKITELSKSPSFLDDEEADDQDQSFDFHPFRSLHSQNRALDSTNLMGWSSMHGIDSKRSGGQTEGSSSFVALISDIDRKMKEHADVLLHSVECLSARVSQMESRTRKLDNALDELKDSIEFYHGRTDGKLREMENVLIEVQGGIQDLKDKQEIAETQLRLQLAKLQVSKDSEQLVKKNSTVQASLGKEVISLVSQQPHEQLPIQPQHPRASYSNVTNVPLQSYPPKMPIAAAPQLPTPATTHLPAIAAPAPQFPIQVPQNAIPPAPQLESNYPSRVMNPETTHQQFHAASTQQSQPSPHNFQPYQPPPRLPPNPQLPQLPQVNPPFTAVNPHVQHPSNHHSEEGFYMPSHGIQRSSTLGMSPSLQQFNTVSAQIHDQPLRHYSESASASLQAHGLEPRRPANVADYYHYSASPVCDDGSTMKSPQSFPRSQFQGGESSYSQLPTARILPHAIPMASSVDSGSGTGGSGNSVQVDDVVDKVVAMGFRRDSVRAMVKKLTENGQSVDLNVVLDKLMNNG